MARESEARTIQDSETRPPEPEKRQLAEVEIQKAKRRFVQILRSKKLKQTRQRELILDTFLRTTEHLTAQRLYDLVQEQDARVGFATVYRTLKLLVEAGIARERSFQKEGRRVYEHVLGEGFDHHHHHLICVQCERVVEFTSPREVAEAERRIAEAYGFELHWHTHELFGLCKECREAAS